MFRPFMFLALLLLTLLPASPKISAAQPEGEVANSRSTPAVAAAKRNLERAKIELRRYVRVEYPLNLKRLEARIDLVEARIESDQRLLREYSQFTRVKYSNPLIFTIENVKLSLLEHEQLLDNLKEERFLLQRYHADQCRLYELAVEEAKSHLEALQNKQ